MKRLPDRWGPFHGIENLPLILVASMGLVFIFELLMPGLVSSLVLSPGRVMGGDYWRFLTFLFVPPTMHPLFMVFWLSLVYLYAESLEAQWGTFRFTVYYLIGAIGTAAVGLVPAPGIVSNVYLNASLALAFAALFPNYELLLFFVLPVKIKYLAYLTWAWLAWSFYAGGILDRLAIVAALLAFFLVLGPDIWDRLTLWAQASRGRRRWNKSLERV